MIRVLTLMCMVGVPMLNVSAQTPRESGVAPVLVDRNQRPTIGGYLHDGWEVKALANGPKADAPSTVVLQKKDMAVICTLAPPDDPSLPGRLGIVKTAGCYQFQ